MYGVRSNCTGNPAGVGGSTISPHSPATTTRRVSYREGGRSVLPASPSLAIDWDRVPVLEGDSPDVYAERVLAVEHPLLVAVVRLAVEGRIAEAGTTVLLDGQPLLDPLSVESADSACLAPPTK